MEKEKNKTKVKMEKGHNSYRNQIQILKSENDESQNNKNSEYYTTDKMLLIVKALFQNKDDIDNIMTYKKKKRCWLFNRI